MNEVAAEGTANGKGLHVLHWLVARTANGSRGLQRTDTVAAVTGVPGTVSCALSVSPVCAPSQSASPTGDNRIAYESIKRIDMQTIEGIGR